MDFGTIILEIKEEEGIIIRNRPDKMRRWQIILSPNPWKLKGGWEGSFREGGGPFTKNPRPSPLETFATVSKWEVEVVWSSLIQGNYNPEGVADEEVRRLERE
jgi:hypothetical protein